MSRKKQYDYYDDEFKATAVELGSLNGVYAKDIAEVLDIHPVMLYRWKKEYRDGEIMAKPKKGSLDTGVQQEMKRLKKVEKEFETLKMEHDLLKKSIHFCSDQRKKSSNS
jgi:transposase